VTDDEVEPLDEVESHRMPLIEHLAELRRRVFISMGAIAIGMTGSFAVFDPMYAWLTAPVMEAMAAAGIENGGLSIVHSPFEGIYTYLRVALVGGAVVSSPVVAFQIWQFVAPGLYNTERRLVLPLSLISSALFITGALFCYYAIFPLAFPFFFTIIDATPNLSVGGYLSAVVRMMLAFGLCFQLPVITFFLARMGLIDHRDMISSFRYAIVGIFVVAALLTPPEVLTQVMLALPLLCLYGIGIVVAWLFTTKERMD
jgi:sec-independent protein translocase protein TatC